METKILSTKNDDIELAGKILEAGGLVAFPTETVYGLGANALNENSVKNIYKAKGRPSDNPLIVHIAKKEDIIPLVKEVTPKAQALIDTFFPGALTIILPKSELVGNVVSVRRGPAPTLWGLWGRPRLRPGRARLRPAAPRWPACGSACAGAALPPLGPPGVAAPPRCGVPPPSRGAASAPSGRGPCAAAI